MLPDRWQFGVTIVSHFLFVPLTIGLAFLMAIMQVQAYRTKDETWDRLTGFFGTLFLINFAMGRQRPQWRDLVQQLTWAVQTQSR